MSLVVNKNIIEKLDFSGKGGKEDLIISCFENKIIKKNDKLFDCIDIESQKKYELKKQKNQQWLDPKKYANLSSEDKKITIVFVLCNSSGFCDMLATMNLGDFVKVVFSKEQLEMAKKYAEKFPKDQIKSGVNIRGLVSKNRNIVDILWEK